MSSTLDDIANLLFLHGELQIAIGSLQTRRPAE